MTDSQKHNLLTPRQEVFCREYLIDFNATQAAVRAGYSSRSAKHLGSRLLKNANVQLCVQNLMDERNRRLQIDSDYVLRQAVALHERCMQQVEPKTQRGKEVTDSQGNAVYEFDATNALKALELIGRHVNVAAFKEKIEMTGDTMNAHFLIAPMTGVKAQTFAQNENDVDGR
ncbi:phage terminase small subunit [Dysgonomonas sp. PH5-45]|uniref:terminase small subunit n=1 Tax=unclassified Dysgonomonas TaxID=2630389 RepID=UPI0024746820|nr:MULTISPECIES: terminase small subunit [unclassified Dysgonomonas]MDH6354527.1 phage terminase small subunit [Dysgonomonas sp. PH5-45]MDH6387417.1 phage terminase small subunit [Dysgonomonas sp. PH5-37]